MEKPVSREQGDNNSTENRKAFNQNLDQETRFWIEEDSKYFLHQALSTPVLNLIIIKIRYNSFPQRDRSK